MTEQPALVFGRPFYFVPICIDHERIGFYGGPAGYQEIRDKAEAVARSPIIIPGNQARENGMEI